METTITIVAIIAAVAFGTGIFKVLSHPTNGKIPTYYKDKYDEYHRRNFPPF